MENFSPSVVGQGSQQQQNSSDSSLNPTPGTSKPTLNGLFVAARETERPPTWQLDLIMEKLRQKSNQLKPLTETSKNIKMALAERRCFLDQNDRVHFQKCLDSLQQSIKVNSLQSMVERLEMISRQLGLKFTPGATGNEWFVASDMFYLELLIDPVGIVQEVKIQHHGKTEQQNVPEMVAALNCLMGSGQSGLRMNDFADFTAHLEGLVAIYQLNADKNIKSKAFIALQALEADLAALSHTYSHLTDGETIVMKSLFGLFQPRKGGHPVKLTYFISPYEFLDTTSKVTLPTDVETIIERKLGTIAIVSIQASTSRKLQMSSTVSMTKLPDGKNIPSYGTLNATNSTALPACFTVNLGKPIPICKELIHAIEKTTGIHCFDFSNPQPILSLVTQHASNGTLDCANNRGLFVALPDTPNTLQVHCYFMTETPNLEGIMASSISFTLASQLPQIIAILRQQVIFNTLVGSCIRVGCKPDMDCMVFEVNALSHQNVSVSFQHPLEDSLVTLEFDLRDVSHPQCRLHAVTNVADIIPTLEEHACKVVQRSLSIPITVRAVIRRWQTMKSKYEPPNPEFNIPVGGPQFPDQLQSNEMSCGAESERVQQQQQQQQSSSQQNSMVPGVVMSLSNINSTAGNVNNTSILMNPSTPISNPLPTTNTNVTATPINPNSVTPPMNSSSSGRHPSGSSSSYTISPVHSSNSNNLSSTPTTTTGTGNTNFSTPQQSQNQGQQQTPMEILSSYMNPLSSLFSNNLGMSGTLSANLANLSGLTLQNLQNLSSLNPNMALQMSMLAQQMQSQNQKPTQSMLIGLLDQVGQRGRRRKRKGTGDSATNPPSSLNIQGNVNVSRPSPSPSPKSPRTMLPNKSPKRRPSEGSDISDTSQGDNNSRAPTPQTPLTPRADGSSNSNIAINLLMSEIGLDVPDPRWNIDKLDGAWNIDITPVGGNSGNSNQHNVSQSMENFLTASKLLSGFGTAASQNNNNNSTNNQNTNNNPSSGGSEFQIENLDSDMEIDTATDIGPPGMNFMGNSNKFSMPKKMGKKSRDFPKRSISLDSHHSTNLDDHGSGGHLQSFMNQNAGGSGNSGDGSTNAVGSDFKPLVTPSLSITPVSTNSSMGQTTVNSLLAAIRPGIEIIPLPNPVQIPNSITVTPIHPKPTMMQQISETMNKKGNNNNTNISNTSGGGSGQKDKKNAGEDGSGNSNATDGSGSNLPKKKSSSNLGGGDGMKKERKRKASSLMASLLDEDGHPIHDFNSGGNKQPKLLGPFGAVSSSGNSFVPIGGDKKSGGSGMSVTGFQSIKNVSPTFGLNLKKPGSPSLNRTPTPKSSSPTPKIGGKPSVSTLKSVSGSPKYPDVTSLQQQQQSAASFKSKINKERKGGNFQGNSKIAKNLCMVGNQSGGIGGGVSNMMPTLKNINESGGLTLANLNPSLLGLSNNPNMRQDSNLADLVKVNFMNKGNMMDSKGQIQQSQATSPQQLLAQATAAVAAQIQRSNSTGGNNNNNNNNGAAGGAAIQKKSGGLLAVIDKLKSQHSVDDTSKKDMSNKDYLKASSAITSDVMQLTGQQQPGKKNGGSGNGGGSGNTNPSGSTGTGVPNPGQIGTGGANNPEYMVKPGGQGLKMTLGKTKSSKDLGSLSASKFKHGLKTLVNKKGLPKLPNLSSSTLSSQTSITKLVAGLGGSTLKKSGGIGTGTKNSASDKDSSSSAEKKSKPTSSGGGGNSNPASGTGNKSRPEDEIDLTRKLYLPPFDGTKFDLAKYQIPKKSSNSSTPSGGTNDNSPKPSTSPSSTSVNTSTGSGTIKSSDKDSTPTKSDVERITSSDSIVSGQSENSKDGSYFTTKEKDNLSTPISTSSSSQSQPTTTTSMVDLPSTGSGSILISSSAVESKLTTSSVAGGGSTSQTESTKIKLSSDQIPFLEEMNKYLSSKGGSFGPVSSPMNLSQQVSLVSNQNPNSSTPSSSIATSLTSSSQPTTAATTQNQSNKFRGIDSTTTPTISVSFGEPDSTTNEPSNEESIPSSSAVNNDAVNNKLLEEIKSTVASSTSTSTTTIPGLEESDRNTPPNKAITSPSNSSSTGGNVPSVAKNYISPESPDPQNCIQDENIYKNTLTIPTSAPKPMVTLVEDVQAVPSSPVTSPDDDYQLIIDVAPVDSVPDKKSMAGISEERSSNSSGTNQNNGTVPAPSTTTPVLSSNNAPVDVEVQRKEATVDDMSNNTDSVTNVSMPPPPVPTSEEFGEGKISRPTTPARIMPGLKSTDVSGSSSSSSVPVTKDSGSGNSTTLITSTSSTAAGSPSSNNSSGTRSIAASPGPVPSPSAVVPVVSVHIVHSPQPNSPALLLARSPLVVQSPHSSHASPYAIDDDLMDEALIGTGK